MHKRLHDAFQPTNLEGLHADSTSLAAYQKSPAKGRSKNG